MCDIVSQFLHSTTGSNFVGSRALYLVLEMLIKNSFDQTNGDNNNNNKPLKSLRMVKELFGRKDVMNKDIVEHGLKLLLLKTKDFVESNNNNKNNKKNQDNSIEGKILKSIQKIIHFADTHWVSQLSIAINDILSINENNKNNNNNDDDDMEDGDNNNNNKKKNKKNTKKTH